MPHVRICAGGVGETHVPTATYSGDMSLISRPLAARAPPMMGATAGFQGNNAAEILGAEGDDGVAAHSPAHQDLAGRIHDTLGLPILLVIHSAGIPDRDRAALLFEKIKPRSPWLDCVFANTGYNAQQTYEAAGANVLRLEIVRRNPNAVGFEGIERHWVV